jgi:hypothetical protein
MRIDRGWFGGHIKQGHIEGQDFLWNPGEGDEHNEKAWARRLPVALRFLLRPGGS